jgi:hypothetical protein
MKYISTKVLQKLAAKLTNVDLSKLSEQELTDIVGAKYRAGTKQDLKRGLVLIDNIDGWVVTLKGETMSRGIWNAQFEGGISTFFACEVELYLVENN